MFSFTENETLKISLNRLETQFFLAFNSNLNQHCLFDKVKLFATFTPLEYFGIRIIAPRVGLDSIFRGGNYPRIGYFI